MANRTITDDSCGCCTDMECDNNGPSPCKAIWMGHLFHLWHRQRRTGWRRTGYQEGRTCVWVTDPSLPTLVTIGLNWNLEVYQASDGLERFVNESSLPHELLLFQNKLEFWIFIWVFHFLKKFQYPRHSPLWQPSTCSLFVGMSTFLIKVEGRLTIAEDKWNSALIKIFWLQLKNGY